MNLHCLHLSIKYDDAYQAVCLDGPGDIKRRFASGDPVADYKAALSAAYDFSEPYDFKVPLLTSSSLEGFVWDVGGYHFDEHDILVKDAEEFPVSTLDGLQKTS